MKKIIVAIVILAVLIGIIVAVATGRKATNKTSTTIETKTVKVNEVTRSVFYSPQYAAIALGYFKENGIEIELTTGQGADKVMTAVVSGQSDIGFAGPEASIYVYNEGPGTRRRSRSFLYGGFAGKGLRSAALCVLY